MENFIFVPQFLCFWCLTSQVHYSNVLQTCSQKLG